MTESLDFLVRRADFAQTRWDRAELPAPDALATGDVLLRVDRFALTANNITYAVVGEAMGYWKFFPAPEGWGRIPVWGFAEVAASRAPGVNEGDRFYGYLPMSSHVRMRAARVSEQGFVDASEHRRELPAVYQQYARVQRGDVAAEDLRALLTPLFGTGFLLDDWLSEQALFGARQVVIASASSRPGASRRRPTCLGARRSSSSRRRSSTRGARPGAQPS